MKNKNVTKIEFDIPEYDIDIITGSKTMSDLFEADGSNLQSTEKSI
jgi:hypothetical protein